MNTNLTEIESRLWSAADELRANSKLRASEYSTPVLGLIFLRYADHKFTQTEQEIKSEQTPGTRMGIDKTTYQARGAFYLPEGARFQYLLNLPESENIGQAITEAMKAIEAENSNVADVLPKTYNRLEKSTLLELLRIMAQIPMDIEGDAFGKVYEYFLGNFAMAEGQRGGEFFTPTSLVKLIVEIIEPFQGRILDPACGSGGMFVQSAEFIHNHKRNGNGDISIYGVERAAETIRLCKMNLAVHQLEGGHQASEQLLRRPASVFGAVRLRDGKSTLQRGPGRQRAYQRRSTLPIRDAPHRQRQLSLDSTVLQRTQFIRTGGLCHGKLSRRCPRIRIGNPKENHRNPCR